MRASTTLAALVLLTACKGAVGNPPDGPPSDNPNPNPPTPQTPYVSSESVARRLSQAELDRTLFSLLGVDGNLAGTFWSEDEHAPYDNDYRLQEASQTLIDSTEVLARDAADRVMADVALRDLLVGCVPAGNDDEDCFRTFIASFLRRAFRRAVTTAEVDSYVPLLAYATEDIVEVDNDFYTAVHLAIRAVLQDPEFLYRIEIGTRLSGFEIASRLSYLLWGTMPDDQLLDEAEAGALDTAAGRRAAAVRMLGDERAREQVRRFHAMWLGYRAIPHDAQLIARLNRETNALIDRVVFDERLPYGDLFKMNETYVDTALAQHYGLAAPAGGEGWVAYDADRAGILSHGAVLAAFSKFTDTSPTQRGIFVRTRLMCDELPPPPPNVDVDQAPEGAENDCKIQRYQAHMGSGSCASCHVQMDPIGFGLENFDIAGRYREHDDGRTDCAIEGVGRLPDGTNFRGPKQLGQILTDNREIQSCAVEQLFQFAIGRRPVSNEHQAIDKLSSDFEANGDRLDDLVVAFVTSDAFVLRQEATP